jgi:hypothetical protein
MFGVILGQILSKRCQENTRRSPHIRQDYVSSDWLELEHVARSRGSLGYIRNLSMTIGDMFINIHIHRQSRIFGLKHCLTR